MAVDEGVDRRMKMSTALKKTTGKRSLTGREGGGMQKRLEYLDMVKGIGIVLVVIGHSTYVAEGVLTWLASFHMPLFFVVSGMLFCHRQSWQEPFGGYVKKRFTGMLVPYFWFSLIYIGVDYYYLYAHPEIMSQGFIDNAFLQMISFYGISVLWFLPALFGGELLVYWICRKSPAWLAGLLGMLFAFVPQWGMALLQKTVKMEDSYFLTWLGDLVMALLRIFPAVTFLLIGYAMYRLLERLTLSRAKEILLGSCLLLLNGAVAFANGRVDLHYMVFQNTFLFFLGAASAALGLVLICRMKKPLWLLSFLGANSLIIMLTHLDCQVMSTAIRFAVGMNQFITRAKDYVFQFNLYLALFVAEMVLIFLINRYFYFLIGKRRPVRMTPPPFIRKRRKEKKVISFRR